MPAIHTPAWRSGRSTEICFSFWGYVSLCCSCLCFCSIWFSVGTSQYWHHISYRNSCWKPSWHPGMLVLQLVYAVCCFKTEGCSSCYHTWNCAACWSLCHFFHLFLFWGGKEGKEICKTSLSLKHGISHMIFILQPACKQCTPHWYVWMTFYLWALSYVTRHLFSACKTGISDVSFLNLTGTKGFLLLRACGGVIDSRNWPAILLTACEPERNSVFPWGCFSLSALTSIK